MSGTKHDQGKAPIHFLTREFVEGVAQAQGYGAKKYNAFNFCEGLSHTRLLDAAFRHLFAHTWGEDIDQESGLPHVFLAGANLNMLSYMIKHHPQLDDRYKGQKENTPSPLPGVNVTYSKNDEDCVCGEINARNCPVHQNYEENIQEFEKFFGLDRNRFLNFSNDKGVKK